jgi:hypothetical protein
MPGYESTTSNDGSVCIHKSISNSKYMINIEKMIRERQYECTYLGEILRLS